MGIGNAMARRRKKKAETETKIVGLCAQSVMDKINESAANCIALEKEIDDLELTILRLADAGESEHKIGQLIAKKNEKESAYTMEKMLVTMFESVYEPLVKLKVQLEALLTLGWHKFLISMVPEKKLPKMIHSMNADDMVKVIEITKKIIRTISDRIVRAYGDRVEAEKVMKQIEDTANKQLDIYRREKERTRASVSNAAPEVKSSVMSDVEAIRKARAAKNGSVASPSMTVPVGVDTPATVNGQNKNTK